MKGTLWINAATAYRSHKLSAHEDKLGAVYSSHGFIRAIGEREELKQQLTGTDYETVDLQGAYVLPGLVDSHMHLGMLGEKLSKLDFSEVSSKEEMLALIRLEADHQPVGAWITGLNWDENRMRGETPDISELDAITDRHPIFLTRTCFHAFLANTAAFERAGLTPGVPDPKSGAYGRDERGHWNGWVYEQASEPFYAAQPAPGYEELKEQFRKAALHALGLGLTAVHSEDWRSVGSVAGLLRIFRELREEGVGLRTHQLLFHPAMEELEELGLTFRSGDEWFRIGAVKLFADGALGGRTALLSRPYADAPAQSGMAIHTQEELHQLVKTARKLGLPVAMHAIGDGGAELALAAMQASPAVQGRDRLIHAQLLRDELVAQMKRLPLAVDIQPRFVASDFPWAMERVGRERLEWFYAWRKLINSGLMCAGGSDAPIEPLNPFLGLHAAMTRRRPGDKHEGYLPEEKLTLGEALQLFTVGSAQAACEETERGQLDVGKRADFTVIDRSICEGQADELLAVKPLMTVVNGETAFSSLS